MDDPRKNRGLTTRKPVTSGSDELPTLPSIRNEELWRAPATTKHVTQAVTHVLALCEPDAPENRIVLFCRMVASRRYTAAELAYAMRELPFDEAVDRKLQFNRPVMPADFERIIRSIRKKRARLNRTMWLADAEELVMDFPEELDILHFHCWNYDENNRPLYRYLPEAPPRPQNPDPNPQDRESRPYDGVRGSDAVKLGDTKAATDMLPKEEDSNE